MRSKLQFGAARSGPFFASHGEKLAMAVVVALLIGFAVAAAGRDTLPEFLRPDSIADKERRALWNIANNPPPPTPPIIPKPPFRPKAIVWIDYGPFSAPPIPIVPKRSEPTLFPVTSLRVRAARPGGNKGAASHAGGALPIPPGVHLPGPVSTGNAEGRRFLLITGPIPEGMQRQEYDARFRNALQPPAAAVGMGQGNAGVTSPDRFQPRYVWCLLERTDTTTGAVKMLDFGDPQEAAGGGPTREERGPACPGVSPEYDKMLKDVARWSPPLGEMADPDCVGPSWLTWPLPPLLLLHDWGRKRLIFRRSGWPHAILRRPLPLRSRLPWETPRKRRNRRRSSCSASPILTSAGYAYRYRVRLLLGNANYGLSGSLLTDPRLAASPIAWPLGASHLLRCHSGGCGFWPPEYISRANPARARLAIMVWDAKEGADLLLDLTRIANRSPWERC